MFNKELKKRISNLEKELFHPFVYTGWEKPTTKERLDELTRLFSLLLRHLNLEYYRKEIIETNGCQALKDSQIEEGSREIAPRCVVRKGPGRKPGTKFPNGYKKHK